MARNLNNLALYEADRGNLSVARDYADRSIAAYRELGSAREVAGAIHTLGYVHLKAEAWEQALAATQEALEMYRTLGLKADVSSALQRVAWIEHQRGNFSSSCAYYRIAMGKCSWSPWRSQASILCLAPADLC